MRLLILLLIAAAAAYFTAPSREAHEAAAQAFLRQHEPSAAHDDAVSFDDVVNFGRGMLAGRGRYENYYVASRYSVDMPGAAYLECYGAYTLVRCREAGAS
jgi:hypothetical protein